MEIVQLYEQARKQLDIHYEQLEFAVNCNSILLNFCNFCVATFYFFSNRTNCLQEKQKQMFI